MQLVIDPPLEFKPLDTQLGAVSPKTIPDALQNTIFKRVVGVPDPETPSTSPFVYAILDAGRVQGLPEVLETSGLPYRCLFTGQAEQDLATVAPYLVALDPVHSFTRDLFTRSEARWHLAMRRPGLLIRSPQQLHDIWRQFRKLTRVQLPGGSWSYFRFWDDRYLLDYLDSAEPNDLERWLPDGTEIFSMVTKDNQPTLVRGYAVGQP